MTTKTFPLTGPIELNARLSHGSLLVQAEDDLTEATVTLTARVKSSDIVDRVTVQLRGSTLHINAPRQGGIFDLPFLGGRRERESVDIIVTVPSGTPVKAASFTADVTVRGRCGTADVASGAADIHFDHVDGDLRLRYGSGQCHVEQVSGSVQARSGSGQASFGRIDGSLSSGCGSGRLDVASIRGAVRSRAGSGDVALGAVYDDVDVASGSGGLSIGLPAGRPARLDVTTGSGRVESDLPIEDRPSGTGRPLTIRARTGSGDIRLFRVP
jgi:hypothetical protein